MMRIIDEQPFEREFTCEGCGSQLAAEASDIVAGWQSVDWTESRPVYYVQCPICGQQRLFEKNDLPLGVTKQADSKRKS